MAVRRGLGRDPLLRGECYIWINYQRRACGKPLGIHDRKFKWLTGQGIQLNWDASNSRVRGACRLVPYSENGHMEGTWQAGRMPDRSK